MAAGPNAPTIAVAPTGPQPSARHTRAVQDYDALVADGRRNPAIHTIRDDPEQLSCSIAALGRHNAEFGQVSAQGIAKHRALAHQQLPGPVQHQTFVLIGTNRSQIAAASFASFLPRLR